MNVFFGSNWGDDGDLAQVVADYEIKPEEAALIEAIIYATYTYEDYSGHSDVLFVGHDGNLYEVHGSHCSCFGLEGQWEPECVLPSDVIEEIRRGRVWGNDDNERKVIIAGLAQHFPSLFVA